MGSFSAFHWIIIICIVLVVIKAARDNSRSGAVQRDGKFICPACGTRGTPKIATRGSLWIEIVLWLCLIVPGLIYSIWRLTTRYSACPACGQSGMIPVASPKGKALAQQFESA